MAVKLPDISAQERPTPSMGGGGLASYRADFGGSEQAAQATMQAGQAMTQTGKQIEHAGDEIFARAKVEQDKIDTLKAEEAFTKLREQQLELTVGETDGYSRLKGAAAVNTPVLEHWRTKFKDAATNIESGLITEEQKQKFRLRANVANIQFQEGILHHVVKESDIYAKEVFDGTVASETRQATANWQDPNAVALSLKRINEAVQAQADRVTEAQRLKANGGVHNAVIGQAIATNNFQFAEEYYKVHKADIDLPTAKALEVAVRDGTQKQLAANYTDAYLSARDSPDILNALADKVMADPVLDDTRKNTIRSHILTRLDRLDKQATTKTSQFEKEMEREISKISSITQSGFEPTLEQVQPLITMSRGTRFQPEVDQLLTTMELTRSFRMKPPAEQAAEITRLTLAARGGGQLDPKIKFSKEVEAHAPTIDAAAQQFGIDPIIMRAQIAQESGGNPKAVSPMGAKGISQFMPGTAQRYGVNVDDPASSIRGQANYMKDLLAQFGGDYMKALAAYNMGEGSKARGAAKDNGVEGLVAAHGDQWLAYAPKETQNYVKSILKTAGGARAMQFDVTLLKRFEVIHEAQKKELKESPITYAVRQELVNKDDPGVQPLNTSDPSKMDYTGLQRRVSLAASMESQYGAAFKPLTPEEVNLATSTLRVLDTAGRKKYFSDLYQVATNNFGTVVSGPRDDLGGAKAYKAIMAQIAKDSVPLAIAGMMEAEKRKHPEAGMVSDLILKGYHMQNPTQMRDGDAPGAKLRPLPSEIKMESDFYSIVRDAYGGNSDAVKGYYETAKLVYLALSAQSNEPDPENLKGSRWHDAIKMVTGEIISYNGKQTAIPWGMEVGKFKDLVSENITGLLASGRLEPGMTFQKLDDMRLMPVKSGVYMFMQGDIRLRDKLGNPVLIDLSRPAPWTPPQPYSNIPTQAELDAAGAAYRGAPTRKTRARVEK
jgi:hypothetical protein